MSCSLFCMLRVTLRHARCVNARFALQLGVVIKLRNGLTEFGFAPVSGYQNGAFTPTPSWTGVYAWAEIVDGTPIPRRIGKAVSGLRGRFRHLNDWLAGTLKPHDAREQAVRHFTLHAFACMAKLEIWAVQVDDPAEARDLEQRLRELHRSTLTLDLQVKGSWIERKMAEWRRGRANRNAPTGLRGIGFPSLLRRRTYGKCSRTLWPARLAIIQSAWSIPCVRSDANEAHWDALIRSIPGGPAPPFHIRSLQGPPLIWHGSLSFAATPRRRGGFCLPAIPGTRRRRWRRR